MPPLIELPRLLGAAERLEHDEAALATGLGAIPVFLLGTRAAGLAPLLLGFAAGVMGIAAVAGLLIPATQEGSVAEVLGGLAVGVGFLALGSLALPSRCALHGSQRARHPHLGARSISFAFAAGAMLGLIVAEMLPQAFGTGERARPTLGIVAGAALMLALSSLLGV